MTLLRCKGCATAKSANTAHAAGADFKTVMGLTILLRKKLPVTV